MKKIMFDSRHFGLTQSVLSGYKTMTRRIIPQMADCNPTECEWGIDDKGKTYYSVFDHDKFIKDVYPQYQYGEIVAVAQSYKNLGYTKEWVERHISPNPNAKPTDPFEKKYPGWNNKMFVRADLMPHQIQITNLDVQRLQDISDIDCFHEGIELLEGISNDGRRLYHYNYSNAFRHPREAFADLIDKLSGKGTWDKNPYVFVYSFKLVRYKGE